MEIWFSVLAVLLTSSIRCQVVTSSLMDWIHLKSKSIPVTSTVGKGIDMSNRCDTIVGLPCTCSEDRGEIDCSHTKIQALPSEISFSSGVKIVDFAGNLIDSIKYETFESGPEVIELDLSNNRIDFVSAQAFHAFGKLRRLDLSHNNIWTLHKGVLDSMVNLRELDLSYNDFSSIPKEFFHPVPGLKVLNLGVNPLMWVDPKQFENLPNLISLSMDATMLKELPDMLFSFSPNLKRVSLANNLVEEIPKTALKALNKVQNLDLSGNIFETIPSFAFPGMKSLRILYLDRLPVLNKIDKYAFSGLSKLQEVHCSYNFNLREIHEDAFRNNSTGKVLTVDQLFMRQNGLSSLSFHLLPWEEYSEIHLRDNPWHCDCHLMWMLGVQVKNKFQDHVTCASPYNLEGRKLSSLKPGELVCGLTAVDILLITLGITIAFLIILLMIAMFVWKRHFSAASKTYYRVYKHSDGEDVVYEKTTCDNTDD